MLKQQIVLAGLALLTSAARADNCDEIKAGIDARLRAGGLSRHSLAVVDRSAPGTGRVIGTCAQGSKKILLLQAAAASQPTSASASAPAAASGTLSASAAAAGSRREARRADAIDDIMTECKDGSIVIGPDCSKADAASQPAPKPP